MDVAIRPFVPEFVAIGLFGAACLASVVYGFARLWGRPARRATARPYPSILMCLLCLGMGVLFYLPYTNDDAFIFLRYSRNLADGHGLVFNLGDRVEGFTSPAWVALIALAGVFKLDLLWTAKLFGVGLAAGAVVLFHRAASRAFGEAIGFACAVALASQQLFLSWAGSGMDVALFMFFQCGLIWLFVNDPPLPHALLATAGGIFVRPEAGLLLGIYWLWILWRAWREGRLLGSIPFASGAMVLALLPFALRWFYFGDLLPNT